MSVISISKNRLFSKHDIKERRCKCGASLLSFRDTELRGDWLSALIFNFFCAGWAEQHSRKRRAHKGRRSYSAGGYFHVSARSTWTAGYVMNWLCVCAQVFFTVTSLAACDLVQLNKTKKKKKKTAMLCFSMFNLDVRQLVFEAVLFREYPSGWCLQSWKAYVFLITSFYQGN